MTDLLVFKLGRTPDDPVSWGAFADGAQTEAGRVANVAALSAIADRAPEHIRLAAVLQGEQVASRRIANPPKQASKLHAAATFLLEDELAQPIDDLHVVVTAAAPRIAYAVSKRVLDAWIAAFDAIGLCVAELAPDYALIGGSQSALIFATDKGRVIAACGTTGFAAETDLAARIVPSFIDAAPEASIIAYGDSAEVAAWSDRPVEKRPFAHEADLIALFGKAFASKIAPINLLAGAYRRRSAVNFRFGPYRRAAVLAAALALAVIVSGASAGLRDIRIARAYETSAAAMHRAAFPTFTGTDVRGHVRQMLSGGARSASFLDMSSRLALSLEAASGVAVDRIRFDAARGQFIMSIRSETDVGIESFRSLLDANGVIASDSGGYRRLADAWVGEMSARAK
ncbi:MAG: hypothetical protein KDD85_13480 [Parvularculaceae bacterium]|nr:hypothetical protein [Parvularculaceae bacterium]